MYTQVLYYQDTVRRLTRILIIDDDAQVRAMLREGFKRYGGLWLGLKIKSRTVLKSSTSRVLFELEPPIVHKVSNSKK